MTKTRILTTLLAGALLAGVLAIPGFLAYDYSSSNEFCMSCHEMRVVGEQGWMHSPHFSNPHGVVADCKDCHVPPGFPDALVTKVRDGSWDVWVHLFGEHDPAKMDWVELERRARDKIADASCMRCHQNLEPAGGSPKMLKAHRERRRTDVHRRCVDCHDERFHGRFFRFLPEPEETRTIARGTP